MSRVTCHVDSLNVLRSWDCVSVCVLDIPQSPHIIRLNRKSVLPLWIIICTVFLAVFVAKICVSFTSKLGLASHFPPNSLPCPGSWLLADGWMIKIWLKVLEEFILAAMIFSLNIHKAAGQINYSSYKPLLSFMCCPRVNSDNIFAR